MLETILKGIEEGELIHLITNNPYESYQQIVEGLNIEDRYLSFREANDIYEAYQLLSQALAIESEYSQLAEETGVLGYSIITTLEESKRQSPIAIFLTDIEHLDNGTRTLDQLFGVIKYVQNRKSWQPWVDMQPWTQMYIFILLSREKYPLEKLYNSCTFVLEEEE